MIGIPACTYPSKRGRGVAAPAAAAVLARGRAADGGGGRCGPSVDRARLRAYSGSGFGPPSVRPATHHDTKQINYSSSIIYTNQYQAKIKY